MPTLTRLKYEADSGKIYQLLLTPDYAAAAGTEPTGGITENVKAKVSKSKTEFGIRPRLVRLSRVVGTAPDDCIKYSRLPVLTATEFNSPQFADGTSLSIGNNTWTIIGRDGEDF